MRSWNDSWRESLRQTRQSRTNAALSGRNTAESGISPQTRHMSKEKSTTSVKRKDSDNIQKNRYCGIACYSDLTEVRDLFNIRVFVEMRIEIRF